MDEKFNNVIEMSWDLKLSILCGFIQLQSSGEFFKFTKNIDNSMKASVFATGSNIYQSIDLFNHANKPIMNKDVLRLFDATHVVYGIKWGFNLILSVEYIPVLDYDNLEDKYKFFEIFNKLVNYLLFGPGVVPLDKIELNQVNRFKFTLHGDILPDESPKTLVDAFSFMRNAHLILKDFNTSNARPIKYNLLKIDAIKNLLNIKGFNANFKSIHDVIVKQCLYLFDNIINLEKTINELVIKVETFEKHILSNKVDKMKKLQFDYHIYKLEARKNLSNQVILVRSGKETDITLLEIIEQANNHPYSWINIGYVERNDFPIKEEISFLDIMSKNKVHLLDKNESIDEFISKYSKKDIFILFYSEEDFGLKPINLFSQLFRNNSNNSDTNILAAIKSEIYNLGNITKISHYRNKTLITDNYEN